MQQGVAERQHPLFVHLLFHIHCLFTFCSAFWFCSWFVLILRTNVNYENKTCFVLVLRTYHEKNRSCFVHCHNYVVLMSYNCNREQNAFCSLQKNRSCFVPKFTGTFQEQTMNKIHGKDQNKNIAFLFIVSLICDAGCSICDIVINRF